MAVTQFIRKKLVSLLAWGLFTVLLAMPMRADTRKALANPEPQYPQIARQLHITGVVRVELVISADGTIKSSKILGGHPVLVDAVQRVIAKWKYAPAPSETTQEVDFKF